MNKNIIFFPWTALSIYLLIILGTFTVDYYIIGLPIELDRFLTETPVLQLVQYIFLYLMTLFLGLLTSYVFIKFPLQAISKKLDVHKDEIWAANFYAWGINRIVQSLLLFLGYEEGILVNYLLFLMTALLFLYFYLSASKKEAQIKRAVIKVQLIWITIGLISLILSLYSIAVI